MTEVASSIACAIPGASHLPRRGQRMHIQNAIRALVAARDLQQSEAALVMEQIMTGEATPAQIAAFLTALHLKGETDAEIAGMAEVMREKAVHVPHSMA